MGAQAAGLTDDEIRELAVYYASQPGPLHTPDIHTAGPKAAAH
jgi:cytochrome c553